MKFTCLILMLNQLLLALRELLPDSTSRAEWSRSQLLESKILKVGEATIVLLETVNKSLLTHYQWTRFIKLLLVLNRFENVALELLSISCTLTFSSHNSYKCSHEARLLSSHWQNLNSRFDTVHRIHSNPQTAASKTSAEQQRNGT